MTQQQLIREYCEIHGSILPAKISGVIFMGKMFGSETSKRCRELRKQGILKSEKDGRFERFYLNDLQIREERVEQTDPRDSGKARQSLSAMRQISLPGLAHLPQRLL